MARWALLQAADYIRNRVHDPVIYANTLLAFCDNATSRVRHQGLLSEPLPVRQGTRQRGKSSPLLYFVYANGLIEELDNNGNGTCLYDINIIIYVLIYNNDTPDTPVFYLGQESIPISDNYIHLGIECNPYVSTAKGFCSFLYTGRLWFCIFK